MVLQYQSPNEQNNCVLCDDTITNSPTLSKQWVTFFGFVMLMDILTSYFRYKPPSTESNPTLEDPTPDYMNLLGMIFSMCGLMLKVTCTHTFHTIGILNS